MSSVMRQIQGMRHWQCSSSSFCCEKKLNKCLASVNVRVHDDDSMSKKGPNFSSESVSRGIQKPLCISAYQFSGLNTRLGGHVPKSPKVFEASSLAANGSLPCVSEANTITESSEILERNQKASEQRGISENPGSKVEMHKREQDRLWEVVSSYFLTLDATVKITMLIFIPCYVAIRVIYGIEVLRELTPLWILAPLIVAFDIKMFQAISQLYVFSFKQTEKAIRSLPSAKKLAEATYTYILQILVAVKNLDYKNAAKLKLKEIMQWNTNISVFFLTVSWPLYWRIIRFLARANLIAPKF